MYYEHFYQRAASLIKKVKSIYLRNIQLQRAYKKMICAKHVIYTLATLDYGQWWLVSNPIPNNKQSDKNSHVTQTL